MVSFVYIIITLLIEFINVPIESAAAGFNENLGLRIGAGTFGGTYSNDGAGYSGYSAFGQTGLQGEMPVALYPDDLQKMKAKSETPAKKRIRKQPYIDTSNALHDDYLSYKNTISTPPKTVDAYTAPTYNSYGYSSPTYPSTDYSMQGNASSYTPSAPQTVERPLIVDLPDTLLQQSNGNASAPSIINVAQPSAKEPMVVMPIGTNQAAAATKTPAVDNDVINRELKALNIPYQIPANEKSTVAPTPLPAAPVIIADTASLKPAETNNNIKATGNAMVLDFNVSKGQASVEPRFHLTIKCENCAMDKDQGAAKSNSGISEKPNGEQGDMDPPTGEHHGHHHHHHHHHHDSDNDSKDSNAKSKDDQPSKTDESSKETEASKNETSNTYEEPDKPTPKNNKTATNSNKKKSRGKKKGFFKKIVEHIIPPQNVDEEETKSNDEEAAADADEDRTSFIELGSGTKVSIKDRLYDSISLNLPVTGIGGVEERDTEYPSSPTVLEDPEEFGRQGSLRALRDIDAFTSLLETSEEVTTPPTGETATQPTEEIPTPPAEESTAQEDNSPIAKFFSNLWNTITGWFTSSSEPEVKDDSGNDDAKKASDSAVVDATQNKDAADLTDTKSEAYVKATANINTNNDGSIFSDQTNDTSIDPSYPLPITPNTTESPNSITNDGKDSRGTTTVNVESKETTTPISNTAESKDLITQVSTESKDPDMSKLTVISKVSSVVPKNDNEYSSKKTKRKNRLRRIGVVNGVQEDTITVSGLSLIEKQAEKSIDMNIQNVDNASFLESKERPIDNTYRHNGFTGFFSNMFNTILGWFQPAINTTKDDTTTNETREMTTNNGTTLDSSKQAELTAPLDKSLPTKSETEEADNKGVISELTPSYNEEKRIGNLPLKQNFATINEIKDVSESAPEFSFIQMDDEYHRRGLLRRFWDKLGSLYKRSRRNKYKVIKVPTGETDSMDIDFNPKKYLGKFKKYNKRVESLRGPSFLETSDNDSIKDALLDGNKDTETLPSSLETIYNDKLKDLSIVTELNDQIDDKDSAVGGIISSPLSKSEATDVITGLAPLDKGDKAMVLDDAIQTADDIKNANGALYVVNESSDGDDLIIIKDENVKGKKTSKNGLDSSTAMKESMAQKNEKRPIVDKPKREAFLKFVDQMASAIEYLFNTDTTPVSSGILGDMVSDDTQEEQPKKIAKNKKGAAEVTIRRKVETPVFVADQLPEEKGFDSTMKDMEVLNDIDTNLHDIVDGKLSKLLNGDKTNVDKLLYYLPTLADALNDSINETDLSSETSKEIVNSEINTNKKEGNKELYTKDSDYMTKTGSNDSESSKSTKEQTLLQDNSDSTKGTSIASSKTISENVDTLEPKSNVSNDGPTLSDTSVQANKTLTKESAKKSKSLRGSILNEEELNKATGTTNSKSSEKDININQRDVSSNKEASTKIEKKEVISELNSMYEGKKDDVVQVMTSNDLKDSLASEVAKPDGSVTTKQDLLSVSTEKALTPLPTVKEGNVETLKNMNEMVTKEITLSDGMNTDTLPIATDAVNNPGLSEQSVKSTVDPAFNDSSPSTKDMISDTANYTADDYNAKGQRSSTPNVEPIGIDSITDTTLQQEVQDNIKNASREATQSIMEQKSTNNETLIKGIADAATDGKQLKSKNKNSSKNTTQQPIVVIVNANSNADPGKKVETGDNEATDDVLAKLVLEIAKKEIKRQKNNNINYATAGDVPLNGMLKEDKVLDMEDGFGDESLKKHMVGYLRQFVNTA
ncbi:uncharacterized protein BBOV_IV007260 [Babesia bovis T2Bo]|uniref:Uncharacterized protein n=1 Tax=Babesia bovis TaxID=5865 RepID=A7ARB3_BABBO|nr:uncharacterized protein BBOV_IV007260 [Babesia bovis T2Bo]EDO07082.1 hypothetical protein BBOV_IV007260 [Babesia bovis T2Bo]|eukprot:XP_001610650.1 hypothetical protein [Babesia bovis T2Bo]